MLSATVPKSWRNAIGQMTKLALITAQQNRSYLKRLAVGAFHAALFHDGEYRADEMLIRPHPSGDAIHCYRNDLITHVFSTAPKRILRQRRRNPDDAGFGDG